METGQNGQDLRYSPASLRRLIVPLIIEQLLAITVGLTDSIMVAQVGDAAISAVSLVDTVNVLLVNAFAALATGGTVIAGQYLGRREAEKATHSAQQLILFMLEASLFITALFYLGKPFVLGVVFGRVEPDVAAYANTYYLIVEASTPFLALYSVGAALFRMMGSSGISMRVSMGMNVINVAGNALLIFGLRMGVEGVAIPTLVSRAAAAVAMLVLLRRPGLALRVTRIPLRNDPAVVKNILHFGIPNGIESSMFQMGKILLLSTVSVLGTASVTANAVGNNLNAFHCVPGNAIGLAIVTVVSRCIGAGEPERARYYAKKMLWYAAALFAAVSLLTLALLPVIMRLYGISPEAERYARQIIWLHALCGIPLWTSAFVLPAVLRAAGDTRFTMTVSGISMWTVRVGFGILLARYWGFGVLGIWIAMVLDWVPRTVLFLLRFHGHRWEKKGLEE